MAVLEQYTDRRESRAVNSVMAIPKSWFCEDVVHPLLSVGDLLLQPPSSRLAISRRNTPDLQPGSRKRGILIAPEFCGQQVQNLITSCGGVKTSSLLRLARQVRTSGL